METWENKTPCPPRPPPQHNLGYDEAALEAEVAAAGLSATSARSSSPAAVAAATSCASLPAGVAAAPLGSVAGGPGGEEVPALGTDPRVEQMQEAVLHSARRLWDTFSSEDFHDALSDASPSAAASPLSTPRAGAGQGAA